MPARLAIFVSHYEVSEHAIKLLLLVSIAGGDAAPGPAAVDRRPLEEDNRVDQRVAREEDVGRGVCGGLGAPACKP